MLEVIIEETLTNTGVHIEDTPEITTIEIDETGVVVVPISEADGNQVTRKPDGIYVPEPYLVPVEQSTGDSEFAVMSQLAVTLELASKVDVETNSSLIPIDSLLKLDEIEYEATKNLPDAELLSRANHTGEQPISSITSLVSELLSKVDVEVGKVLSSNDYTDEEKVKLLDIAIGATKNQTDLFLLNRMNHSGEQPISTISGLSESLSTKVDKVTGKQLSTNDFTAPLKSKLDGISSEATKNQSDSYLITRSNHVGVQPLSSVDGLPSLLDAKVDKVAGKGLSTNDYTTAERDKLAGLESSRFRGVFTSLQELEEGVTNPQAGYYAQVDTGSGSDAIQYIYDVSDNKWIAQESATPITAAQVKQMYESNPNTNALTDEMAATVVSTPSNLSLKVDKEAGLQLSQENFTTGEKLKLSGVEAEATKNAADASLRDRSTHTGEQPLSSVSGLPEALDSKVSKVVGQGLSDSNFTQEEKDKLLTVQEGATRNRDDTLNAGVSHTHEINEVDHLQDVLNTKLDMPPSDGILYGVRDGVFVPLMAGSVVQS